MHAVFVERCAMASVEMRAVLHDHDSCLDGIDRTVTGLQPCIACTQSGSQVAARALPFLWRHAVFGHDTAATVNSQRNLRYFPLRSGAGATFMPNTALLTNARSA